MAIVAANVRERRVAQGLSLHELALTAGLTPTYLQSVEEGCVEVRLLTLDRLAQALCTDMAMLVTPRH